MRGLRFVLVITVLIGLLSYAYAQEVITTDQAANFIGHQKTVCGMVASAHFAAKSRGQPTLLNIDKPYPNQLFTVLIWGSSRDKFEKPPETLYNGKDVCVSGMIESYEGRPRIVVGSPAQIKVK